MKRLEFSNKTLSAQWPLLNEWFNHLNPALAQPLQQLQALVQSTLDLSLQRVRQRHWAQGRKVGQPRNCGTNGFFCRRLDPT